MSTQQIKQEAKYYTRTPNILFESYEHLHPQEKWLYINLVYLCGKEGTRHLSLRYISDRTGISIGALSGSKNPLKNNPGMIRNLHNAGLIHAEIKRRVGRNGKESEQAQYHISIVDIWQLNLDYFTVIPKCSDNEQSNGESVQNMNTSVQNMNSSSPERSENERERSDFDTNIRLQDKTTASNKTTKQEDIVVSAIAENDAPAATIHDLQKWKEESGKHKAITLSDSQVDIGNEETVPRMESVKIGDVHANTSRRRYDEQDYPGDTRDWNADPSSYGNMGIACQGQIASQQKPDAGTRSSVVNPPVGGQNDSASVQATTLMPAVEHAANSHGALQTPPQVAQGGKRTRTSKKVTQAKPAIVLTAQEQAFWDLWCGVWFNLDIPPDLTETAYGHVKKLAPFITTSEQLNSLIDYTRKDLAASQNIKRKMVQLGNMVFCYAGWKQAQRSTSEPAPERDPDYSDFDIYKGNGKEERAAMLKLYDEMVRDGRIDIAI